MRSGVRTLGFFTNILIQQVLLSPHSVPVIFPGTGQTAGSKMKYKQTTKKNDVDPEERVDGKRWDQVKWQSGKDSLRRKRVDRIE